MSDPDKHEDQPGQELDPETIEDLEPDDADEVTGGEAKTMGAVCQFSGSC